MAAIDVKVRFGYAEVDITPTVPVECVGFGRQDNLSRGVLDKLLAQIVIWENHIRKLCIVVVDNIGFTAEINNRLRTIIAGKLHIDREQIMVCFSHTHSGPNADAEKGYFDFVCRQISEGIGQAINSLSPVKAVWGNTEADIGVNRRNPNGSLDRRIGILKIVDAVTNELRLMMLRVTAHANVLTSDNYLLSSDFFGAARKRLEEKYNCKIVITQGASGNVRPKHQHSMAVFMEEHPYETERMEKTPALTQKLLDESMEALNKMAEAIDAAVGVIIADLTPEPVYRIAMFSETATFSADVPTIERARAIVDEARNEEGIDGTNWLAEVSELQKNDIRQQNEEMEIQYFTLNNGCWCGVASEVMCETALDISQQLNNEFIYFGGYTNGCGGYLPTAEEYNKGGYEVLWSYLSYYMYHCRVMPLNRDTADKLTGLITNRLRQAFAGGRIPGNGRALPPVCMAPKYKT